MSTDLGSSSVVVIGAGQAGLAVSRELTVRGVEHVVLERDRVAQTWRTRWESFTLVTPNWTMALPGHEYAGDDPEGFVPRDAVVDYLESYAASFGAPIVDGVAVDSIETAPSGGLMLKTSAGEIRPRTVLVCTGAFQRPYRPAIAGAFPERVRLLDATEYRRPSEVGDGAVLIVGSGQTGCQLAEDLHLAGREVFVACGRAPWVPRRAAGRDIVSWVAETTFLDAELSALPNPLMRLVANFQTTGRDGGHDLHYRTMQAMGINLVGRLTGVDGSIHFAPDLAESVAFGDARYNDVRQLIATQLPAKGLEPPELPDPEPFTAAPVCDIAVDRVETVIFTAGFRPDYARWVRFPIFDDLGYPITVDGATSVPGLYFCGVHFMRRRRSGLLFGVGEDAALVAASIVGARTA